MTDASVPLECLVGKKPVGHLLPSFGWLTREVHWSGVGQPLPWLRPGEQGVRRRTQQWYF